jgi:glycosyltransferase involved in cell wall biosynthesis/SAM-dependent methyltransferase
VSTDPSFQVVLDLSALQGEHAPERGIARYVLETTRALLRRGAPVAQLGLTPMRAVPDHIPDDLLDTGLAEWLDQRSLERRRLSGFTVLHVFSPFELVVPFDALYPPAATAPGFATTATVYDAIPSTDRDHYLTSRLARNRYDLAARHLASCDRVFGISRHACTQAVDHLGIDPRRVDHVGAGAAHFFQPVAHTGDQWPIVRAAAPQVGESFILAVGGGEPRKNIEILIEAVGMLPATIRDRHRLVQVGALSADVAERWRRRAREVGLADEQLVLLGRVDDIVLRALYQTCRLFVFPSLDEGFGLPVLEAARCGAAVLTSDAASVPEVLDDPSTTFDPCSAAAVSNSLAAALSSDTALTALRATASAAANRHTWDGVADRMIHAWSAVPGERDTPTRRRHIAVVGVFDRGTSSAGAVARQQLALADALAEHATVTCFDVRDDVASESRTDARVMPARALGAITSPTAYDDVIHLLGPIPGATALRLLRAVAGTVVADSSGTARSYAGWPLDHAQLAWLSEELAGPDEATLHPKLRTLGPSASASLPDGRPFGSRPLLRRHQLVVANSPRDASLFRLDLGPNPTSTRVAVSGPSAIEVPMHRQPTHIVVVGDTAAWAWTVHHLAATLDLEVEHLDLGGPDPLDRDRRWRTVLPTAAVVLFLDHDAPRSHLAWAAEAVSAMVPVVTTGTWWSSFPPGVVRFVEPSVSNVSMYAQVAALAQPSPLRREQQRAAGHFRTHHTTAGRAREILGLIDGLDVPPPPALERRPIAPFATASALCRAADFDDAEFRAWSEALRETWGPRRKLWEYVVIAAAFERAGVLRPDARGLGFGVGTEPLTAAFAARGATVTASDLDADRPEAAEWSPTGQHAAQLVDLNARGICPPDEFERRVEFRPVDMNAIPADLHGRFDFCWSSCAFEHLGSIDAGLRFVERSLDTLRPGGIAVHTTELVLSSDVRTLEGGSTVLFRESDLRALIDRLEAQGHVVAPLDTELGDELLDQHVDVPPFRLEPHLKLELGGHITTSVAIIVRRGDAAPDA